MMDRRATNLQEHIENTLITRKIIKINQNRKWGIYEK